MWRNEVSKTGTTLEVPLSDAAMAIVEERLAHAGGDLAKLAGRKALIFAGQGGGRMAHSNLGGAPKRAGIEDAATPHGWRSVCSDALSEHCHISREVREAVLGHALPATEGPTGAATASRHARRPWRATRNGSSLARSRVATSSSLLARNEVLERKRTGDPLRERRRA